MSNLTVLMPVYNSEQYLSEAISSILNQTYTNFNFIIIDDGSTDQSLNIIKSFADKDNRIIYFTHKNNKGAVETRNACLKKASSKFIAFMDSDDISHPERLEKQINFMQNNPTVGLCGSYYKFFGKRKDIIKLPTSSDEIKTKLFWTCPILQGSCMLNTELTQNILFKNDFIHAEEYGLQIELLPKINMNNIDEVLYYYRIENHNMSVQHRTSQLKSYQKGRLLLLNYLTISPSQGTLETFNKAAESSFPISKKEIRELESLFITIIKKSKVNNIFDTKTIEKELKEKFFWACFYSSSNGIIIHQIFKTSLLKKNISLKHKIEFYLRCLFQIKT